jgi:hypothetical protein
MPFAKEKGREGVRGGMRNGEEGGTRLFAGGFGRVAAKSTPLHAWAVLVTRAESGRSCDTWFVGFQDRGAPDAARESAPKAVRWLRGKGPLL